jgi:hypothetical protein
MALDYILSIETNSKPEQLSSFLVNDCGFKEISDEVLEYQGVTAGITIPNAGISQSIFQEAYNFSPNIEIWFRLGKFGDLDAEYQTILLSVLALLKKINGNSVLLFNSEITVLLRLGEELVLDSNWNSEFLTDIPYNLRPLASPLK